MRARLTAVGVNVGPITATTRAVYEKQLEKKLQQNRSSGTSSNLSDDLTDVRINVISGKPIKYCTLYIKYCTVYYFQVIDERQFPTPPRPTMVRRPLYGASSSPSHTPRSVNRNKDIPGKNLTSSCMLYHCPVFTPRNLYVILAVF